MNKNINDKNNTRNNKKNLKEKFKENLNKYSKTNKFKLNYPKIKKSTKKTNYFGTIIEEPFEKLEDLNSKETLKFIEEENNLTEKYLSKIKIRDLIKKKLKKTLNYPKESVPFKINNFYYFFKNSGIQNQSILYRKKDLKINEEEIFLNPNEFSKDQTSQLSSLSFSKDGKYLAYSISNSGSEYSEIFILNVEKKEKLKEEKIKTKFDSAIGYTKVIFKGNGFFYSNYKNNFCKIYYHKIGGKKENDTLIYEDKKNKNISFGLDNSPDEKYLYIYPSFGNHLNSLILRDNLTEKLKIIFSHNKYESEIIFQKNNFIYLHTNQNSPNKQIYKINLNNYSFDNWELIFKENNFYLEKVFHFNNLFLLHYLENASSKIYLYDENFDLISKIELPTFGTTFDFKFDKIKNEIYFNFTSFVFPNVILKYLITNNKLLIYKKSKIKFDSSLFKTKQIWYESKDKTKIPMFIISKKNIKLNSKNKVLLYGYGGFNISITPFFSIQNILFLEQGGILAVPNLRGGGEFGENWHKSGIKEKKQNVFDDFISAAEYLINNDYTSNNDLGIMGGSNGGLLVGAVMTQKPELFKIAIPIVGVLDMLKFQEFGCGMDWIYDYGYSKNKKDFNYLIKYSPLHNIKNVKYPSTLIMTSQNDNNVSPSHSYKFTAMLQEKNKSLNPILLRIEKKSGHQGGSSISKLIEEITDRLTFIFNEFNLKFK